MLHTAAVLGGEVPVWDIAAEFGPETNLLVVNMEQGRSLARTLGSRRVALMHGHGSVVAGGSLREVVTCCVYLELNARLLLQALALGRPIKYLTDAETEHTAHMLTHSLAADRAWTTWAAWTFRRFRWLRWFCVSLEIHEAEAQWIRASNVC